MLCSGYPPHFYFLYPPHSSSIKISLAKFDYEFLKTSMDREISEGFSRYVFALRKTRTEQVDSYRSRYEIVRCAIDSILIYNQEPSQDPRMLIGGHVRSVSPRTCNLHVYPFAAILFLSLRSPHSLRVSRDSRLLCNLSQAAGSPARLWREMFSHLRFFLRTVLYFDETRGTCARPRSFSKFPASKRNMIRFHCCMDIDKLERKI